MRQYLIAAATLLALQAQGATELALRTPGGAATTCKLTSQANGGLMKPDNGATLPLKVFRTVTTDPSGEITTVTLEIKADQTCWFNISETEMLGTDADHNSCEFYMPGFWYHITSAHPKKRHRSTPPTAGRCAKIASAPPSPAFMNRYRAKP